MTTGPRSRTRLGNDVSCDSNLQVHVLQRERNWLIQQMQGIARMKCLRISFLSGDVHCAAVGVLKTLVRSSGGKNNRTIDVPADVDYKYMLNVVTSMFFLVSTPSQPQD
jgi:hypothetical protein